MVNNSFNTSYEPSKLFQNTSRYSCNIDLDKLSNNSKSYEQAGLASEIKRSSNDL